mgnify:CR=1 FL=1
MSYYHLRDRYGDILLYFCLYACGILLLHYALFRRTTAMSAADPSLVSSDRWSLRTQDSNTLSLREYAGSK